LFIHTMNVSTFTAVTFMGIKAWSDPHISLHIPK